MIVVVANVANASNSMTEPAEEDDVVEKCGFNFVFESYSVHDVQICTPSPLLIVVATFVATLVLIPVQSSLTYSCPSIS